MKRSTPLIALFAVMLVLGVSVGSAWAYFTDSTSVEGGLALSLKPTTSLTEDNQPNSKVICVKNTSDVASVWVRVHAYARSDLNLSAQGRNAEASKWVRDGDWYVYTEVVPAGAQTEELIVSFDLDNAFKSTGGPQEGAKVSVIVDYQSMPVTYDANGNPVSANWKD